jgi:hypothetical protein
VLKKYETLNYVDIKIKYVKKCISLGSQGKVMQKITKLKNRPLSGHSVE